jgi:hypothetical protein
MKTSTGLGFELCNLCGFPRKFDRIFDQKQKTPKNTWGFLLSDQGSNLDSTEPKSVVLPVTPSDNLGCEFSIFSLF